MTKKYEIYKCDLCGNITEIVHVGSGELVCCKEPMQLMRENSTQANLQTQVPVTEKTNEGFMVNIGKKPHSMEKQHHIQWVQIITEKGSCRHFFSPGDIPQTTFPMNEEKVL